MSQIWYDPERRGFFVRFKGLQAVLFQAIHRADEIPYDFTFFRQGYKSWYTPPSFEKRHDLIPDKDLGLSFEDLLKAAALRLNLPHEFALLREAKESPISFPPPEEDTKVWVPPPANKSIWEHLDGGAPKTK